MSESRLFIADRPTGHTITEAVSNKKPSTARKIEVIPAPAVVLTKNQNETHQDGVPPAPPVVLAKREDGDGT